MSLYGSTFDEKKKKKSLYGQTFNPDFKPVELLPLERKFQQPNTAPLPSAKPITMRSSHAPAVKEESDYKSAFIKGTVGSLLGRAVTPLVEKLSGKRIDLSTLPESNTLGEKAVGMIGSLGADLPLWMGGDALLAKPLSMLAKTKPIAKIASAFPKITPALGTGVRAGATFGGPINAVETAMNGDGVEGFTERLKEAPMMALGGTALHGGGQLLGSGIKKGIGEASFLKSNLAANKRVANMSTPAEDFQSAFFNPSSTRSGTQARLSEAFANTPNLMESVKLKPLQRGVDDAIGIRKPLSSQSLAQRELDAQSAFGGPREIKGGRFTTGEQRAFQELQDGITEAQNFVKHTDVLAAYPAGTTVEQAYADVAKNTGVNLPKLLSNYEKAQNVRGPLTQQERIMGRQAGVIPPLKQREGFPIEQPSVEPPLQGRTLPQPERLTWTNKDVQNVGPLPIRSITDENLAQLPGRRVASPRITANDRIPSQGPIRSAAANIEGSSPARITIDPTSRVANERVAPIGEALPETLTPGTADSFRSKVDRNPAKGKTFSEKLRGIRTQFVDDVAPLENVEKSINGKVASAEDSLYKQARLFRGSPERADELVQSTLTPIIKKVEKSGQSTKDLGDYALAVHARDVNAKGINSGFTNEEIAATIQKFSTPEMEASRKELMKISNDSLDSLAEAGLIDKGLVTTLREKHPNYMPLFRSFEDDKIEFASGISKAMANVTAPINKLVGSGRNVIDPIESMIKNIYKSVSAVDRNKVASQLGKLADKDANGAYVRRLAEGEEKSRLNTVYAMEDGAKVHYEVQPDVYKALMNLDKESSNMLIRVLQKPAGLLRSGATLTPEFSLRNPIRDVVQAFAVSKSGINPVTDVPKALFDVIRSKMGKDTMYNQFLKDNAGFGNIISMDRKAHQEVMNDILSQPASKKFVNIVSGKSLLNVLRTITDVTESATKLGEYKAALRSGASRPEAAYRARDLMDFARAGASIRETNKIVAFLNANIQGKSKLYRAIKENPVGVTARAFSSITVPTIGVYMAQQYLSNDEQKAIINDAPDWMTSTFWLVPVPGTSQVARIPKPFDLAPIFANLPERALKYMNKNDPTAFDGFAKQTLSSASLPTMITGLIPLIEGMSNYSMFKQGPIIPQREADLNFPDQYDIRTTGTAKLIAKGVDKLTGGTGPLKNFGSPRVVDNTIQGLTAGLGNYVTSAIDFITESTGIVDAKNKPARNLSEMPLLRAFLTSEKSGGKAMGNMYDEKDKLTRDKGSALITSPKAKFPQETRLKSLSKTTATIGDITKEIRKIENSASIDAQTKRLKINDLASKRNALAGKIMGK